MNGSSGLLGGAQQSSNRCFPFKDSAPKLPAKFSNSQGLLGFLNLPSTEPKSGFKPRDFFH